MKIDNGSTMRTLKSFLSVTPMVALSCIVFAATTAANAATRAAEPQAKTQTQNQTQNQNPAAHKPFVIAHRGGKRWAPENSLSAFKKSLEAGVDGIELDIHKCKSGELVVIHDDTLNRTTNGTGYVKDATWQELSQLDSGSWYSPAFKGEKLPRGGR